MLQYIQQVIKTISAWENVETYLHPFGSIEFRFGMVQIGHIHMGSGFMDIPFPRRMRAVLVAEGEADCHHTHPESGWITLRMRREVDIEQGIRLYRLSYLHKRSYLNFEPAALQAAVAELGFSDAVVQTLKRKEAKTE